MNLHSPLFLILLPFSWAIILYAHKKASAGIRFSTGSLLSGFKSSLKVRLSQNLFILRLISLSLIIIAFARPQGAALDSPIRSEGIDIVLALDCSTSMLAEDFKIGGIRRNRIDVVKSVVRDFVKARPNDRIGLVAFASRAYTISPLTLDHDWLMENLGRVQTGLIEDGTAIGLGVASSLNRLKNTKTKSKIIILLTDGRNNTGNIAPLAAAEAARALNIKVYTIGAGAKGPVPYPARDYFGRVVYQSIEADIDEDVLSQIASITNGKYFRATDTLSLQNIYKEIDALEKTPQEQGGHRQYNEYFKYFLIPGFLILLLEIILANTFLRKLP